VYAAELHGFLHCLNANTGELYWQYDTKASIWGSPYYVDGKVLLATESGDLFVFRHHMKPEIIDPMGGVANNQRDAKRQRQAARLQTEKTYLVAKVEFPAAIRSTPIVVNGVMYVQAGTRRTVVALDPVSGEMLWMWRMDEGKRGASAPRQGSGRGLAYWTDGKGDERIVTVTPGYHLAQLNAKTGIPVATFGKNGIVDLKTEIDQPGIDLENADIGLNSPPALGNNVIVVGAAHLPGGAPRTKENVKGYVRGYDVRTGKRLWIFHTIPQPGEFGNDTWEKDSWSYTGNAGNWGPITIDEELNRVYLATEDGTGDYFGGHRPGNNLFSASVVCRLATPVIIPPGRERLFANPIATGLPPDAMTIAVLGAALTAARTAAGLPATMIAGFFAASSAARASNRSVRPLAQRSSMTSSEPSFQPRV